MAFSMGGRQPCYSFWHHKKPNQKVQMEIWASQLPGLLTQEMALKSVWGRRVALRIQWFMPGHTIWLFNIVSQHTVYGMFLLTQNSQSSLLSASGLQEQKTTDLLRSSSHCLKAALTLPPWCLVGKSYSGIAHLPSNPVNTTLHPKRESKMEPQSFDYFLHQQFYPNHSSEFP